MLNAAQVSHRPESSLAWQACQQAMQSSLLGYLQMVEGLRRQQLILWAL